MQQAKFRLPNGDGSDPFMITVKGANPLANSLLSELGTLPLPEHFTCRSSLAQIKGPVVSVSLNSRDTKT